MSTSKRLLVIAALAAAVVAVYALKRDQPATLSTGAADAAVTAGELPTAPTAAAEPSQLNVQTTTEADPPAPAPEATVPASARIASAPNVEAPTGKEASARSAPAPAARGHRSETANAAVPRLLDVGADVCIPCKAMVPVLEELRQEYAGRLRVDFIDAWKSPEQAEKFDVYGIPTQIFFDPAGHELERHLGFFSKEQILATWQRLGYPLTPVDRGSR